MAFLTAQDYAQQMIAQLRILDPSVSAEIGTPERKIIDTVAQALADNQIDLTGLQGALDIDAKFGTNLDRFTALFGFARQAAKAATGFITFSRNTPALADIIIPVGTVVQSNTATSGGQFLQYATTLSGTIAAGDTDSTPVQVQCIVTGAAGNTAANTLTNIVGTQVIGVTSATNTLAFTNGRDVEDDNSYKVRFKNTWARNLSGTTAQYLALAIAGAITTKANVIGIQSRYLEYIQVPDYDDTGYLKGTLYSAQNTGGSTNHWTTALSGIPFAKQIYPGSSFVSNGQSGAAQFFYRPDTDFTFNPLGSAYPFGDTNREYVGGGPSPNSVIAPNFTFLNVFNPASGTPIPGLQAVNPGDIVLSEFGYVSASSRNDIARNINNAVDIYVDGDAPTNASCIFTSQAASAVFINQPTSPYYNENFRRHGQPSKRPILGNYYTPLFNSPLDALPSTITINGQNYYEGYHYWLVHEIGPNLGSIRARDGIEWSAYLGGDIDGTQVPPVQNADGFDVAPYVTTGATINAVSTTTPIPVNDYQYDSNILTLQATMEDTAKQVTTDVLVHKARLRYFVLDITVMYDGNANFATVNAAIGAAVQAFFARQYFGAAIQLSDLLEVIHQVPGVDNVRWSNDLPSLPSLTRLLETDQFGVPLHGVTVDRFTPGSASATETQKLYLVGSPNGTAGGGDSFTLYWGDPGFTHSTAAIPFVTGGVPVTAAQIQTAVRAGVSSPAKYTNISVVEDVRSATNVAASQIIRSFVLTYGANGAVYVPEPINTITQSSFTYDNDFILQDNELPVLPSVATSLNVGGIPGLIIRPRAQNTWARPGIG